MAFSNKRVACPSCRAQGADSTGNHLHLYEDEKAGWCHKEQKTIRLEESMDRDWKPEQKVNLAVVQHYPVRSLDDRGITQETAAAFDVRVSTDEVNGQIDCHYYPYHDTDGNIVGYKKRVLPKQFSVLGKIKGLFGQKNCKEGKFLLVCEGEIDAMSAYQMLREQGKNYNVVSLPNGASEPDKDGNVRIDSATLREIEWITQYGSIALCLDQDAVGQAYAQALAEMLASQCKVAIIKLPHKDANEMLKRGKSKEFLKALFDAKPYHPESIVEGKDVSLEALMTPKEPGIELPYPKLQKMTWGLRKGEITLITAGSGLGKSTLVRELGYDLVNKKYRIAHIALETVMEDVARSFIAMDNNIPVYNLMFRPDCIPQEDYERSFNHLIKSSSVNFFKHWGSIQSDTLLRKCQYYVKALGVDFIFLDHVSMVVAGNESENERKDIDRLFENMTRLVVETGVGVVPVMHLKRVAGKSFNKGDEVELTDLRGSAGAEQMSWNVWALERNQQGEQKDIVNLRVLKNRLLGFTGLADTLIYSHETGRLQLFDPGF